jgi:LysR family transcriptional regulator for metE and metH
VVEHLRGVCVLPEWLADSYGLQYHVKKIRLGKKGIYKTLYAASKKEEKDVSYINTFIKLGIDTS